MQKGTPPSAVCRSWSPFIVATGMQLLSTSNAKKWRWTKAITWIGIIDVHIFLCQNLRRGTGCIWIGCCRRRKQSEQSAGSLAFPYWRVIQMLTEYGKGNPYAHLLVVEFPIQQESKCPPTRFAYFATRFFAAEWPSLEVTGPVKAIRMMNC